MKIKDQDIINKNNKISSSNFNNINNPINQNPDKIPVIKGYGNDLKDNIFANTKDDNVVFKNNIVYNEDIFKNKKFSDIKRKPGTGDDVIINNRGLVDILQDQNWGNSNKNKNQNFESFGGSITHGKIYRDLGKSF